SIEWYSGLCPANKRLLFIKKTVLEPDAFVCSDKLDIVWQSPSVDQKKISAMRKKQGASA
ncbi:MAG TPA: hypothetical protein VE842_16575, partial [Pyrinomonadaceae bacterium]|nr:hypothetical protein [Pyrinomonadaceae bacterium]